MAAVHREGEAGVARWDQAGPGQGSVRAATFANEPTVDYIHWPRPTQTSWREMAAILLAERDLAQLVVYGSR